MIASKARRRPRSAAVAPRASRGYAIALGTVALLIVLLIVGLLSEKKSGSSTPLGSTHTSHAGVARHRSATSGASTAGIGHTTSAATRVALSLKPSAPVWVCLIADGERKAIPGLELQPSYTPVTYHASRFTLTLGNGSVTLYVNGQPESVPATSNPIGYSITSAGRHLLSASQQPTCG